MTTILLCNTCILWKEILKFWNPMVNLTVWDHNEVIWLSPYCYLFKELKNNMAIITQDSCCAQTPPKLTHWLYFGRSNRAKSKLSTHINYTGCPKRNVPDFGRVFLMLKYTDITQNTYVQSWTVMEIMAREVTLTAVTHLLITKYILKLAGICGFCIVNICT